MKPSRQIWTKTGMKLEKLVTENEQKSMLNFAWKMVKNGKIWPKNGISMLKSQKKKSYQAKDIQILSVSGKMKNGKKWQNLA